MNYLIFFLLSLVLKSEANDDLNIGSVESALVHNNVFCAVLARLPIFKPKRVEGFLARLSFLVGRYQFSSFHYTSFSCSKYIKMIAMTHVRSRTRYFSAIDHPDLIEGEFAPCLRSLNGGYFFHSPFGVEHSFFNQFFVYALLNEFARVGVSLPDGIIKKVDEIFLSRKIPDYFSPLFKSNLLSFIAQLSQSVIFDFILACDLGFFGGHAVSCRLTLHPNGYVDVSINDSLLWIRSLTYKVYFQREIKLRFEELGLKLGSYAYCATGYQVLNFTDCCIFAHADSLHRALTFGQSPQVSEIAHFFQKVYSREGFNANSTLFGWLRSDKISSFWGDSGVFRSLTCELSFSSK
jgi:hypothetical protein